MRVPVLRPLSLGEVLDTSFGIYRQLFAPLLLISVITQTLPLALGVFVESAGGLVQQPSLWMLSLGLALVLGAVGTAASTFVVAKTYLGSTLSPSEGFLRSTPYMGRLIGTSLLVSLLMGIGMVFLIIPGIIAACGLLLTPAALVLEDVPGGTAAMGRSFGAITRGFRLKIFGALVVAVTLIIIPGIALGALAVGTSDANMTATMVSVIAMIIQSVLQILAYPFFYVLTTVLYYDLRVRKEGFDLEMLATSLQSPG